MGLHRPQQFFPLRPSQCLSIHQPIGASIDHALQVPGREMHLVCPNLDWKDRTESGGQEIIPGQSPLPGNRKDVWGVPWIRGESRHAVEAWRRRFAVKYAVANQGRGQGQGQDRVGDPVIAEEEFRIVLSVILCIHPNRVIGYAA